MSVVQFLLPSVLAAFLSSVVLAADKEAKVKGVETDHTIEVSGVNAEDSKKDPQLWAGGAPCRGEACECFWII